MSAMGIHDHPTRKLGRAPAVGKPALMLADILTGELPVIPPAADFERGLTFPMNGNNRIGDCFPVSVANHIIATSAFCGTPYTIAERDVIDLYSRISGYDPRTGAHDDGCVMQLGLEELLKNGIGGLKPVAFAEINAIDSLTLERAVAIFGGTLWGVDLRVAQQAQTDASPPVWDFKRASADWGGHAIYSGRYGSSDRVGVVSWEELIDTTTTFRLNQLGEVWVPIWPWHLDHPAFLQGVDIRAFADAYHQLTGRTLPLPASPAPTPPAPAPPAPAADLTALIARLRKDEAHGRGAHLSAADVSAVLKGLTQS